MNEHILDTGPLVGWINRRVQWHAWSVSVMAALPPPLITCEGVIAETAWHLQPSRNALDQLYGMVESGAIRIVVLLPDHIPHLRACVSNVRRRPGEKSRSLMTLARRAIVVALQAIRTSGCRRWE